MSLRFFAAVGLVFCFLSLASAEDAARVVQAPLVGGEIVVDGKLDEAAWKEGPWTSGFVVFSSDTPAEHQTKVAVRHDNTMLYLAAVPAGCVRLLGKPTGLPASSLPASSSATHEHDILFAKRSIHSKTFEQNPASHPLLVPWEVHT